MPEAYYDFSDVKVLPMPSLLVVDVGTEVTGGVEDSHVLR